MKQSQGEMLANRVRKSARHLRKWAKREDINCYRLYDRDIPEIPLAIDWYDGRLHIAEYEGKGRSEERDETWLDHMAGAAADALDVARDRVFVKRRRKRKGGESYEHTGGAGEPFVVREGAHRFWVNLADYTDTGLFLDHRPTRRLVAEHAGGARLLNLFAYTGSFTVYAALAGAAHTVSVDLSRTYIRWLRDNLALNDVDDEAVHKTVCTDVFEFLAAKQQPFDIVVLDPPTFSNSKRMERDLDIRRDHSELINAALAVTKPDGTLYFSTNKRGFRLDESALADGWRAEDISEQTIPSDFRDRGIHRCYRIVASS